GRHPGGRGWFFDALADRAAFDALVDAGLAWLATSVLGLPGGSTFTKGRLTLMAHSGGGAGMRALLKGSNKIDPDEIVCFDSMYGGEKPIVDWALAKIGSAAAPRSGLRAFYTACSAPSRQHPSGRWVKQRGDKGYTLTDTGSWVYNKGWSLPNTEPYARRLGYAMEDALAKAGASPAVAKRFRVEQTGVSHPDIPARYSPLLLDDISADVPKTQKPPDRSTPPECVANPKSTWLTHTLVKPGGDDPPPPLPTTTDEATSLEAERLYEPPDRRAYTPSATATLFRTPPEPVAVATATEWPDTAPDADRVSQGALRALGVTSAGVATFSGAGLAALSPLAGYFGEAALIELLRRLRYDPSQLTRPPHSFANDAAISRAFGKPVARPVILAIRTLLAIPGCGVLTAAKILGETAGIDRFVSKDAYARHNGTAPLPVWSSNKARHRLSRTGNRQLNAALHRIALTQAHWHPDAKAMIERRKAGGDSGLEALRILKRRLSDVVYRALLADLQPKIITAAA
ncbi:MAG: transposase, partial [Catenulispora sp.]